MILPRLLFILFALPVTPLLAASAQVQTTIAMGQTNISAPAFQFVGDKLTLTGGVVITAPDYGLNAQQIVIDTVAGKSGPEAIAKVVALGDPAHHDRVTGHFSQTAQGRTYSMAADQAVYTPDPARPGEGEIAFTGNPVLTVSDPVSLAAPAVTTADQITVVLGKGPSYPQIQGQNGHITLTPRQ